MDIAEGPHLEDIVELRLVDTGTGLERLGIAGGNLVLPGEEHLGNLVLPEEEHLGNLVLLNMQEVVGDIQLVGIELRGKAELEGILLELLEGIVACTAILEDKLIIEGKHLGSLQEDTEVVVIMDNQILLHQLELPLYSLEEEPSQISEPALGQRLELLMRGLFILHRQ